MVGFVFNKYIRNRFRGWWMQYNYIFSAGLDVGLALSTIVLFCALELTNINFPNYWGVDSTSGALSTMDATDTAIQAVVASGQQFGPATW